MRWNERCRNANVNNFRTLNVRSPYMTGRWQRLGKNFRINYIGPKTLSKCMADNFRTHSWLLRVLAWPQHQVEPKSQETTSSQSVNEHCNSRGSTLKLWGYKRPTIRMTRYKPTSLTAPTRDDTIGPVIIGCARLQQALSRSHPRSHCHSALAIFLICPTE